MKRAPRSLLQCEQGAVLVMSLFATSLLVALIFYVLSVGHAIEHGQRLHDAADSAAFSQAVMSARGMNLMALLNMVKLSVVAVSTALVASSLAASETIAWILSSHVRRIVFGWTIPFLAAVQLQATTTYLERKQSFSDICDAAQDAQKALREQMPLFAQWRSSGVATSYESVSGAFVAPLRHLPTEPEPVATFCARVFPYTHLITHKAFQSVPSGVVKGHARDDADAFTTPLCVMGGVTSQRLMPNLHLGDEPFQTRLYAYGDTVRNNEESGIRMATWRRDETPGQVGRLREKLSQVGLAQAEYYFDGTTAASEMLWDMKWKARMRRFRGDAGFAEFSKACASQGRALECATVAGALEEGRALIIH